MAQTQASETTTTLETPHSQGSIAAAVALFFLAPLVAEFLLGNLPIKMLPALIVLAPMYGGGALLIREVARRTGHGWPSIFALGMAYAIFEEAFTTQSLFNPNYLSLHLGLLKPAYIPALGIGGWWTLWMFNVHAVWSIATPIALIEGTFPDRAGKPWLGRMGMIVTGLLFAFGAVVMTKFSYKQDHFVASHLQFSGAALVCVLFVVAAFLLPRLSGSYATGWVPGAWVTGAMALAAGSAALLVPMRWGWGAFAAILAIDILTLILVLAWSRRSGWNLRHKLALASGAALAYGWHAFLQPPAVGGGGVSVRIGNAVFLLAALWLIWMASRRTDAAMRKATA